MKTIKGDLLKLAEEGHFDVIIHGCNCFCAMGAGIAAQIAKKWPQVAAVDAKFTYNGDASKLGTFTECAVHRTDGSAFLVVNAYTQFHPGRDVHYEAIRTAFKKIAEQMHEGVRIGYPKIGAGIAGGDWNIISKTIDEELDGYDHTLVEWDGGK